MKGAAAAARSVAMVDSLRSRRMMERALPTLAVAIGCAEQAAGEAVRKMPLTISLCPVTRVAARGEGMQRSRESESFAGLQQRLGFTVTSRRGER